MKKKRNFLILAGLLGVCAIFYALTMLPQDILFSKYKKALDGLQHPANTKLVKAYSGFGALEKNRIMYKDDFPQGCDYMVGEIREYTDTRENIRAFYAAQTVRFMERDSTAVGVMFIPRDPTGQINPFGLTKDENIQIGPGGIDFLQELQFDQSINFLKLDPRASYYFVSIGGFSQTDFDLRCQF